MKRRAGYLVDLAAAILIVVLMTAPAWSVLAQLIIP